MPVATRKFDRFGQGGAYTCVACGKKTRDTGHGEAGLDYCKRCYVTFSIENVHNDNDHPGDFADCAACRANLRSYGL